MKKYVAMATGLVVIGSLFFWNTYQPPHTETIKIGAALGLTGDASAWAEASMNGAQLAISGINKNGGVNGQLLELVVEDTKSTSKDTVSAVSKLQNIDHVNIFLVTWLDVYQGAESLLKPGQLMISPDAGVEAVNGERVHAGVFTNWYRTQPKSELIVEFMALQGKKKLYIVAQNDSYYTYAVQFMKSAAQKHGIEIVGEDLINSGADVKTILAKIRSENPDAVWFAFYDNKAAFDLLTSRKNILQNDIAFYGDEFVQQNYLQSDFAGLFEDVYFYAPKTPNTTFLDAYTAEFGVKPVFGASTSYDAIYMIAQMLKDAPEDIDSYMRTALFETVSSGTVTFDEIGGIETPENYFTIKQIKNGEVLDTQ